MDSFEFALAKPIKYAFEGNTHEGQLLVLYGPSNKHNKHRVKLQQGFFRAANSLRTSGVDQVEGDSNAPTGPEILALMLASDVDMELYHEQFKKLIVAPDICKVEDRVSLTDTLYDEMSPDDTDKLMGEYLANFILSSALETLAKT